MTGYTDVNVLVEVINSGVVYKYVAKPWNNDDLHQTVTRAVEHYETSKSQHELTLHKARLESRLKVNRDGFVKLVAAMLDLRSADAHAHACRITGYAVALGKRFHLDQVELEELALAAFLHEIGTLTVSGEIRHEEIGTSRTLIKNTESVAQILMTIPHLTEIAAALRYQYENFDGSGAPENLCAEQIPLYARIIAAADFYDSLTVPANSQKSLSHDAAVERLQAEAGKKFDPFVVEEFSELKSLGLLNDAMGDSKDFEIVVNNQFAVTKNKLSPAEVLRRIKSEPQLALEILRAANAGKSDAPLVRLSAAMSSLSEAELSRIIERNPAANAPDPHAHLTAQATKCAVAAQLLAAHSDILNPDEAYALGLLFNRGETLLADLFPVETAALESGDLENNRYRRQHEIFGIDALQISRRLLESCGLPPALTSAVVNNIGWMRVNKPAAVLMQTAFTIALADEPYEKTALDTITADMLEILHLRRTELEEILTRTGFISDGMKPSKDNFYRYVT